MADEWAETFLHGFHPKDPKFYYYKIRSGSGGKRKVYYMIGKNNYTVISKALIPPEIIDQIPEFDPLSQDLYIEKKQMDALNKKCERYTHKIENCTKLKGLLEHDVERLIFTYGRDIDISWYEFDPQCYYHLEVMQATQAMPPESPGVTKSGKKKTFYSYKDHRTIKDINLRRSLVLQNDKEALKPTRKIARNLPFSCEKITPFEEKWLIWSKKDQIDNLVREIEKTIALFNKTQKHIETLTFGIDLFMREGINTNQKFYEGRQKEKQLWEEFGSARREKFDSFFERVFSWYVPPKAVPPGPKFGPGTSSGSGGTYSNTYRSNNLTPRDVLAKYKINGKKEWKEWLRNNHPDKGGTQEDCQKVIAAGRELGY